MNNWLHLLRKVLESNYLVDRIDIQCYLQEQLKQYAEVERKGDRYKKPACLGVIAYNHDIQRIEDFLAKETILASCMCRHSQEPPNRFFPICRVKCPKFRIYRFFNNA
jgi:hypothetical protein